MARDTRKVWAKRVERLADSGLSAKEFAAEIGVNANTLAGWRWRLGGGDARRERGRQGRAVLEIVPAPDADRPAVTQTATGAEPIAPMKFVELTARPAAFPPQPATFEIVLRSGQVVRVPGGFDAAELARLVGVLEEVRS